MSTTPESPRSLWPTRKVRVDDQSYKRVRMKLASDEVSLQTVLETALFDWLDGNYDVTARNEYLKANGKLPQPPD